MSTERTSLLSAAKGSGDTLRVQRNGSSSSIISSPPPPHQPPLQSSSHLPPAPLASQSHLDAKNPSASPRRRRTYMWSALILVVIVIATTAITVSYFALEARNTHTGAFSFSNSFSIPTPNVDELNYMCKNSTGKWPLPCRRVTDGYKMMRMPKSVSGRTAYITHITSIFILICKFG